MRARISLSIVVALVIGLAGTTPASSAASGSTCPSVREIEGPSGYTSWVVEGVNGRGDLVGWGAAPPLTSLSQPLVWLGGKNPLRLPLPQGFVRGSAIDINDGGEVIGEVTRPESTSWQPVVWVPQGRHTGGGRLTPRPKRWHVRLLPLPSMDTEAALPLDINNSGVVVGDTIDSVKYQDYPTIGRAVRWSRGDAAYLTPVTQSSSGLPLASNTLGINDRGYIAVNERGIDDSSPAGVLISPRGTAKVVTGLPGQLKGLVGLNDSGTLLGSASLAGATLSATWRNGQLMPLELPVSRPPDMYYNYLYAKKINNHGTILGSFVRSTVSDDVAQGIAVWRGQGLAYLLEPSDLGLKSATVGTLDDRDRIYLITQEENGNFRSVTCQLRFGPRS